MWGGKLTDECFESTTSVLCKKHKDLPPKKIPNIVKFIKKKKKIFLYLKIHIMDPFFFQKPFDLSGEILQSGCFAHFFCIQSEILPLDGFYRHRQLDEKTKETILLFDSVITYTLSSLLQDCIICKNCKNEGDYLEDIPFEDLQWLHNLHGGQNLEEIMHHIIKQPPYEEVRKNFPVSHEKIVNTAFLIAYISYHMLRNQVPVLRLYDLEDEMTDIVQDETKLTGNEEYRRKNYSEAIALYTAALKHRPYNYILYGNRAQAYLKLKKYDEAEIDSRAAVTLCPEWCKGYFKLTSALVGQNNIHRAHLVAALGIRNCENPSCQDFNSLKEHKENIEKECEENNTCSKKIITEIQNGRSPDFENKKSCSDDIEDIPELTDSSNSDSSENEAEKSINSKDIPELIDSSNSDSSDNEAEENISPKLAESSDFHCQSSEKLPVAKFQPSSLDRKISKSQVLNAKQKPEVSSADGDNYKKFEASLKEGSSALSVGLGHIAINYFHEALTVIQLYPEIYKYEECNMVSLKYAYGYACYKSGTYEDLKKAIEIFEEILNDHSEIRFPAAYYGLGLSYFKLNRFKEAMNYFKTAYSIIEKGVTSKVYCWPGTDNTIEETKSGKLKVFLEDFIEKSECPPAPDAKCCYEHCSTQPCIYYTDPDFKGFLSIHCQERCILQYHPSCWKSLKETFSLTDKEFLDCSCLTPDCEGQIVRVESIGRDGVMEKCFISEEIEKSKKNIKQKKSKLEKKFEMKELRKRKRNESLTSQLVSESQEVPEEDEETCQIITENVNSREITPDNKTATKETEESNAQDDSDPKQMVSNLSANAKPFYVIKKDLDSKEIEHNTPKRREPKKKSKRSTLSLDEFCGSQEFSYYYTEYQIRLHRLQESRRVVEEDDSHWSMFCESEISRIPQLDPSRPFHIPEDLRDNPDALEAVLQSYSTPTANETAKAIKENVYSYLEHILSFRGPLRFQDPELVQEVQNFPSEAKQLISDCGGFREFMTQSMRFAVVDDRICVISDVLKAYALSHKTSNGQGYSNCIDDIDEFDHIYGAENGQTVGNKNDNLFSPLNPNAVEYNPEKDFVADSKSCATLDTFDETLNSTGSNRTEKNISNKTLFPVSICAPDEQSNPSVVNDNHSSDKVEHVNSLLSSNYSSSNKALEVSNSLTAYNLSDSQSLASFSSKDMKLPSIHTLRNMLKTVKQYFEMVGSAEVIAEITSEFKPFAIIEIHKKMNKCVQAGVPVINMISQGVMKENDELEQALENVTNLEVEKADLEETKNFLEEQLETALDTVTKLQNKGLVEKKVLEKDLEDIKSQYEAEKKQFKSKQKNFESEQKRWQQMQSKMIEDEKLYKQEIEKNQAAHLSSQSKFEELQNKYDSLVLQAASYSEMIAWTEKKCSGVNDAFKINQNSLLQATERAQKAEIEILNLRKNNFVVKVDEHIKNTHEYVAQLEDGIHKTTLPSMSVNSLTLLLSKLKEHINTLSAKRCNFLLIVEDQINEVKKGKTMAELKTLEIPIVPPFPTMSDITGMSSQNPLLTMFLASLQTPVPNALPNDPYEKLQKPMQELFQPQMYYQNTDSFNPGQSIPLQLPGQNFNQPYFPSYFSNQTSKNCGPINTSSTNLVNTAFVQNQSSNYNQLPASVPLASNLPVQQLTTLNYAKPVIPTASTVPQNVSVDKSGATSNSWSSWKSEHASQPLFNNVPSSSSVKEDLSKLGPQSKIRTPSVSSENNLESDDSKSVTSFTSLPPVLQMQPAISSQKLQANPIFVGACTRESTADSNSDRDGKTEGATAAPLEISTLENAPVELGYTTAKDGSTGGSISSLETNLNCSLEPQPVIQKMQRKESKNSYEKLFEKLQSTYPNCSKSELMEYVGQCRKRHNNKLSGLTLDSIVSSIGEIIHMSKKTDYPTPTATPAKMQFRPRVLVNRPVAPQPPPIEKPTTPTECPWAKTNNGGNSTQWSEESRDNNCIICLEDMTRHTSYRVDCGHRFHLACIRAWLSKTSNCPVCRVHLLLPEDYPALT